MTRVTERQAAQDSMKAQYDCSGIFPVFAFAEGIIEATHEIGLIPGVYVLLHELTQVLRDTINIAAMATDVGESDAGDEIDVANGHVMKVTAASSFMHGG